MATRECPSCGNMVEENQAFCPMCGTKMIQETNHKKSVNEEFERNLLNINNSAEMAFIKFKNSKDVKSFNGIEAAYLNLLNAFPLESRAYSAYVEYLLKYFETINQLPAKSGIYVSKEIVVNRCKTYLDKAKEFADEFELEKILQLDSILTQKIETIKNDPQIEMREAQAKKAQSRAIKFIIGMFVVLGVMGIIYLFL